MFSFSGRRPQRQVRALETLSALFNGYIVEQSRLFERINWPPGSVSAHIMVYKRGAGGWQAPGPAIPTLVPSIFSLRLILNR